MTFPEYADLIPVSEWWGNGDIVSPKSDLTTRLKVTNKKIKKAVVQAEDGKMWEYRITALVKAKDQTWDLAPVKQANVFVLGELVRFDTGRWPGIYTVLATQGAYVRVAKLGGEENRYVRANPESLIHVDITDAFTALQRAGLV